MVNIFGKNVCKWIISFLLQLHNMFYYCFRTRPRYLSFQRSNISSKPGHKVRTGSHVDERHDELRDLVLCQGRSNPNFNLVSYCNLRFQTKVLNISDRTSFQVLKAQRNSYLFFDAIRFRRYQWAAGATGCLKPTTRLTIHFRRRKSTSRNKRSCCRFK